ncbi:YaaR family protein [Dendrosporobacter sp. 1207_IL3150]|uniref:YaaR family protein n=1 Tax=Dendrosporobacter sp. 1207_IL3150 TaxID=3084054 RepID=UPI002FDA1094
MKINNRAALNALPISDSDSNAKPGKTSNPFSNDLLRSQAGYSKERLDALMEQITKQGARLGQVPTYSELKTYRELVRSFISETVSKMYTLQSQTGWDRQGRQKMYTTIKKVDDTLASLTEDVRNGQDRQLEIMAKQDAIRGMLVDLYM